MNICPKCSGTNIAGPAHISGNINGLFTEFLEYTCRTCGFSKYEPTEEQKRRGTDLIPRKENKSDGWTYN